MQFRTYRLFPFVEVLNQNHDERDKLMLWLIQLVEFVFITDFLQGFERLGNPEVKFFGVLLRLGSRVAVLEESDVADLTVLF